MLDDSAASRVEPRAVTIFLHVPKTAGTSFRRVVEDVYVNGCISVYSLDSETLEAVKGRLGDAQALYGHLFYGIHSILDIPPRYVAFVRDPVQRVISYYRHQARDEGSEHFTAIANGMTLLDLLESESCHEVNNHMVRIVSGYGDANPVYDVEVLEQALEHLSAFECLGVAERMDESVALISRRLGWDRTPSIPRLNVGIGNEVVLDAATRNAILSCNELDLQFYETIVAGFDRQYAGVTASCRARPS